MKLFDFVDKLRADRKQPVVERPKTDLGTCVPLHALSDADRKKRMANDISLEKQLSTKKSTQKTDDLAFIDTGLTKDTKIKEDTLGLGEFGFGNSSDSNAQEVIIPQHKKAVQPAAEQPTAKATPSTIPSDNVFRVTGLYDFGSTTMISGFVEKGTIANKMKWQEGNKEISVAEIKIGSTKVKSLIKGEEGSIFVRTRGNPIVRYDDVLEFS